MIIKLTCEVGHMWQGLCKQLRVCPQAMSQWLPLEQDGKMCEGAARSKALPHTLSQPELPELAAAADGQMRQALAAARQVSQPLDRCTLLPPVPSLRAATT